MKKSRIAIILSLMLLLSGCSDNLSQNPEQDFNQDNEQSFNHAITGQLEINEYIRIITDVYYDGTETLDGIEFYNNPPYICVQDVKTGRIRSAARIPTGLVSEMGALSPKHINMKSFEVGEGSSKTIIIAVAAPCSEEEYDLAFYQFHDDLYGIYPLNREFGMPMDTKTADFDTLELVGENGFVCGDFSFEFSLEPYPGRIKMNTM